MVRVMRRLHLFEFHELAGFPVVWRDLVTDFLSFFFRVFRPYVHAAPVLAEGLRATGDERIVDLCSGAGAPLLSVVEALETDEAASVSVVLTDLFPNLEAFRAAVEQGRGRVECVEDPVDATSVPAELDGFRTMFTAFHHFEPEQATRVLRDAARRRRGIAVFEITERKLWLWALPVLLIPLLVWVSTPWIRPLTWRRLLWTYLIPVVPLVAMWDGLVSNLRTYTPAELEAMAARLGGSDYRWRAGRVRAIGPSGVTYLIGWPEELTPTP
jgi:hypothetical protein